MQNKNTVPFGHDKLGIFVVAKMSHSKTELRMQTNAIQIRNTVDKTVFG
jgi:hypothetical protein